LQTDCTVQHQFLDRYEAGRRLGRALLPFAASRPVVLALARRGVPVGYEVARSLDLPLDLFIVRQIGVPGNEELPLGAVASGGLQVLDRPLIRALGLPPPAIDAIVRDELRELSRREQHYGVGSAPPVVRGRTVILVDDGVAVGLTMQAAVRAIRLQQPSRVIVAVPVASRQGIALLESEADDVVCLCRPHPLVSVGLWYQRYPQITDAEVRQLIDRARERERLAG
jgi:predicted phosphoribosyltransferase